MARATSAVPSTYSWFSMMLIHMDTFPTSKQNVAQQCLLKLGLQMHLQSFQIG